jgi:hypothetical protein
VRIFLLYARQRLFTVGVVGAVCLVTLGSAIARSPNHLSGLVMDVARALLLIAAFRAWDDVMDRGRDRLAHPNRINARSGSERPLAGFAVIAWLAAMILLWIAADSVSLLVLLACTAWIAAWYRVRAERSAIGDHVLLTKYAAFTLVLAGREAFTARGLLGAAVVYLSAAVYEWVHDIDSPVSPGIRSIEVALLAAACLVVLISIGGFR